MKSKLVRIILFPLLVFFAICECGQYFIYGLAAAGSPLEREQFIEAEEDIGTKPYLMWFFYWGLIAGTVLSILIWAAVISAIIWLAFFK